MISNQLYIYKNNKIKFLYYDIALEQYEFESNENIIILLFNDLINIIPFPSLSHLNIFIIYDDNNIINELELFKKNNPFSKSFDYNELNRNIFEGCFSNLYNSNKIINNENIYDLINKFNYYVKYTNTQSNIITYRGEKTTYDMFKELIESELSYRALEEISYRAIEEIPYRAIDEISYRAKIPLIRNYYFPFSTSYNFDFVKNWSNTEIIFKINIPINSHLLFLNNQSQFEITLPAGKLIIINRYKYIYNYLEILVLEANYEQFLI